MRNFGTKSKGWLSNHRSRQHAIRNLPIVTTGSTPFRVCPLPLTAIKARNSTLTPLGKDIVSDLNHETRGHEGFR